MNRVKIKNLIKKYIWLLVPIVLNVFFVGLIIFVNISQRTSIKQPDNTITPTVVLFITPTQAQTEIGGKEKNRGEDEEHESFNPEEQTYGLLNKEILQDGTLRYTYTSSRSDRQAIIISNTANEILFERIIEAPGYQYPVTDFLDYYGDPERIVTGSYYYGENAKIYIFAKQGATIIVDSKTQLVLEYHRFIPMNTDEYIQKYGEDIINK